MVRKLATNPFVAVGGPLLIVAFGAKLGNDFIFAAGAALFLAGVVWEIWNWRHSYMKMAVEPFLSRAPLQPPMSMPSQRAVDFYGKDPWSPETQAERAEFMRREAEAIGKQLAEVPPSTGFYFGKTPGSDEGLIEIEGNRSDGHDHGFIVMNQPKRFRNNK